MPVPGGNIRPPATPAHDDMNNPFSVGPLARSVGQDFLRARRTLVICEIVFKFFEAWILVPIIALVLAIIMARAGHVAVSNLDILHFVLTPLGLLYAALLSIVAVSMLLFEQAGVVVLTALTTARERPP